MNSDNKKVLAVGAHPDDVESFCAGTLFLLRQLGYQIHIATMTLGDCGSTEYSAQEIRRIRRKEAEAACELLGASYQYLGFNDLSIYNDDISNRRITAFLREIEPLVVMTHPPNDYMSDHEVTSLLFRNACFYAPAPNYDTLSFTPVARSSAIPYLYYFEPLNGIDIFGEEVPPQFYVDISQSIEMRLEMLGATKASANGCGPITEWMIMWRRPVAGAAKRESGPRGFSAEPLRMLKDSANTWVTPILGRTSWHEFFKTASFRKPPLVRARSIS